MEPNGIVCKSCGATWYGNIHDCAWGRVVVEEEDPVVDPSFMKLAEKKRGEVILRLAFLPPAVWTPDARVVCPACNNGIEATWVREMDVNATVRVPDDDEHVTVCDGCGCRIGDEDPDYIVRLANFARREGFTMEQTGGMCAAAVRQLWDGKTVVVTSEDGWTVGLYETGVWEEGGEALWYEQGTEQEIVEQLTRIEGFPRFVLRAYEAEANPARDFYDGPVVWKRLNGEDAIFTQSTAKTMAAPVGSAWVCADCAHGDPTDTDHVCR